MNSAKKKEYEIKGAEGQNHMKDELSRSGHRYVLEKSKP